VALAQSALAPILPAFLVAYPAIRLELHVSNRRVDVLAESFDVALRVRSKPSGEDGLVMRTFREADELLVASPAYLKAAAPLTEPAELKRHTTLDYAGEFDRRPWELLGPAGESVAVEHRPRLVCHDFVVLHQAVLAGLGIARLPESVVRGDLKSGALVRVLPAWRIPQGIVHVVFPTRRGMLPAVRAFIDFLAERLPAML
jgi:DNA-binding transcriptional LysR family regulator